MVDVNFQKLTNIFIGILMRDLVDQQSFFISSGGSVFPLEPRMTTEWELGTPIFLK